MKQSVIRRVAQILFAAPFAFFGVNHLMAGGQMAAAVPFPPQTFWVYVTGFCQLLAAIAFIANVKVRLAAILLGAYLVVVILSIQLPQALQGAAGAMTMLFKDIGLLAGSLLLLAALPVTLTPEEAETA